MMEIPFIKWSAYLMRKYLRYVYLFFFLLSLCFPFNPPHNTFNLIENFHLPSIAYPISYIFILIFFILLVSNFSVPPTPSGTIIISENKYELKGDDWNIPISNISGHLHLRVLNYEGEKSIWILTVKHPSKKELNLIMTKVEKKKLEGILRAYKT